MPPEYRSAATRRECPGRGKGPQLPDAGDHFEVPTTNVTHCDRCEVTFDARRTPICPACLVERWLGCERFIRPKHDPRLLPMQWEAYRSVLNPSLVMERRAHLAFAAQHGVWHRDRHYDMYVHFTFEPLGNSAGSGIPRGHSMPEHSLDSMLIAEADSTTEAHAFAVTREQFEAQIRAGEFEALDGCEVSGCANLRVPGRDLCTFHGPGAAPFAGPDDHQP
jgi:hypothetical protein